MKGLSVSGVTFRYDGTRDGAAVLRGVDLAAPGGTVTSVVGPNGSGKSTLLKVISGYLRPHAGSVMLNGQVPHALVPAARSALVTYCGDEPEPAFDFTVRETVLLGQVARGPGREDQDAADRAMEQVGVYELRDRAITSLSSGERQRVYIARAVCQDPEVFLLDEPTAHLDMAYELQVMEMVVGLARDRGKTVLTVVHDLNLALRFASRLFFLKDGSVVYSLTPDEVNAEVVREVYGVESWVTRHPALDCPIVIPAARVETTP